LVVTFALILTGYIQSTVAALLGAVLMFIALKVFGKGFDILYTGGDTGVLTFETIIETIGLLMGMMIMVGILSKTGFFQWTALKAYEMAKGDPWKLMVILILFTSFLSAFLDNVTTVLLMVPVTIELASVLKVNPVPMLITEAIASSIGGTATVIGDPPNIMIGAAFQLNFLSFIINLAPIILLNLLVLILLVKVFYKKELGGTRKLEDLEELREKYSIKDMILFKRSILIFCIVMILFIVHDFVGITLAEAALIGAVLLLFLSGVDIHEALESVEWTTLLFFAALFVIIIGAFELGLISAIADTTLDAIGGNPILAIVLIVWVTAIVSSLIGAIPTTAMMIPIVSALSLSLGDLDTIGGATTLYWALCLGQGLGGNSTPIGHAASIVVVGFSERTEHPITYKEFLKVGLPITAITTLLATIYLLVRYVVF
jgi:Na+/H+ antiporter NhaD/arsenite permease-like protein